MLTSPNPAQRKRAFCHLVQRVQAEASLTNTAVAEHLGISRQLYERKLHGEASFNAQEILALFQVMPLLLGELAAAYGQRVMPAQAAGTMESILSGLGDMMGALSRVTETTTGALPGGLDGAEATRIEGACKQLVREIGEFQAAVAASVTTKARR